MANQHGILLRHCVRVLDTYNSEMHSLEDHVNAYITCNNITAEDDETFIVEVFSGSVRYSPLLTVVIDAFYNTAGKNTLKSEENLYRVICYLVLFRLTELTMTHFKKFVQSQDINRMYRFLNFMCSEKNLLTWMKDEWAKRYESSFIEREIMQKLRKFIPDLNEMIKTMRNTIENKTKPKKSAIPATETIPFNITKPKARSIPMPEPIPKLEKFKPPPKTLYKEPSEFDRLASSKEDNRRKAEERYLESSRYQPAYANPAKSQKTVSKINAIKTELDSKLEFEKHRAKPAPSFLSQEVPIKMNAASILREGNLYRKKEEKEIKKLEALEAGSRDASDFLKWQTKMRSDDLDLNLKEIERRRLEGKLSHEEAILARQNIIMENKKKVTEIKEETKMMMSEYLEKKFKEEKEMRMLVEDTMEGHKQTKEAQKKLKEYKQKIVQEVNAESQELMKQALEEAEEEMRRKMELIHQIRAMEAVPVIRQKFVDFTATAGAGLLSEMSIAELKERLSLLRIAQREEEETKRDDILSAKQDKDQLLLDTLETISKHRTEQTKSAAIRLQEKKTQRNQRVEVKDEELLDLQKRLEEKKSERLRLQESAKIIPNKYSADRTRSLNQQKRTLEESRWRELEQNSERTAKLSAKSIQGQEGRFTSANRIALLTS